MSDELLVTNEDGVAVITLNRPEKLNAISKPLQYALQDALKAAAKSSDVGCVVLTGAGRGFCAGGDRSALASRNERHSSAPPPDLLEKHIDSLREINASMILHDMGKPTISMINGPCAGFGLCIAGACDFRFAAESASFTSAYMKVGLSGDAGGAWYWTQILGTAKARRLYMLCEKFDAPTGLAFGLVHDVWPDDELRPRTMEIAKSLANGPRAALRYAKEVLNAAEEGNSRTVFNIESFAHALSSRALTQSRKQQ